VVIASTYCIRITEGAACRSDLYGGFHQTELAFSRCDSSRRIMFDASIKQDWKYLMYLHSVSNRGDSLYSF